MATLAGLAGLVLIALGAALLDFPYLGLIGMPAMATGVGVTLFAFSRQFTRFTRWDSLLIVLGAGAFFVLPSPIGWFYLALPTVAAAVGVLLIVFSGRLGRVIPVGALLIVLGSIVVLYGALLTPFVFLLDRSGHNLGFSFFILLDRDHSVFLPFFWVLGPGLVTFGVKFCTTWSWGKLSRVFLAILAIFPLTMLAFQFLKGIEPLND